MKINDIIRQIRFAGLGPSINTLSYSLYRELLDRSYLRENNPQNSTADPGSHQETTPIPGGVRVRFERAELEVLFLAPDLVRVSWTPGTVPIPYALDHEDWPQFDVTYAEKSSDLGHIDSLASDAMRVVIHDNGRITYQDWNGREQRTEQPPELQGQTWKQVTILPGQAHIYGLGERSGSLDHNPGDFKMWNRDPRGKYGPGTDPLYISIPVYQVLAAGTSHLVFYENSFPAQFSFLPVKNTVPKSVSKIKAEVCFEGGMLRSYFIPGPPDRTLKRYTDLTGHPPMPPRWALGYHQSRWGYKTEADIRAVAMGFKQHELPIDAIHLDIDYMDGYRVFTINPERFPSLKSLANDLMEQGIKLVTILDPGIKVDPQFPLYQEGIESGTFCQAPDGEPLQGVVWPGKAVFPDFTNPNVRQWWARHYQSLLDAGVAGFWHDMNEPASMTAWGNMTLPLATRHDMEGRGGDHREAHNLYGLLMDRAGYEALETLHPSRRPWILSRSGWVGLQRYAWTWTGDVESSWASLRMTIPSVLGLGLSGIPYSGPDIGGFSGDPSAELYLRWFQLAAFLPFFRTHSALGTSRREPWVFGEPYLSIVREFLKLRYRLMPYLYTLAWEASQTGYPIARPLFWIDPDDEELHQVDDCFLLGSALLVAPVLEREATGRSIRLPVGRWYSFWDESFFDGPGYIRLGTSLDRIPVLVRAGSILPMEEEGKLILHVFPADKSASEEAENSSKLELFSDAGDGPASGMGQWRVDRFYQSWDGDNLNLVWELPGETTGVDPYPFPYHEIEVYLHGMQARWARIDGLDIHFQENKISTRKFHQIRFGNW